METSRRAFRRSHIEVLSHTVCVSFADAVFTLASQNDSGAHRVGLALAREGNLREYASASDQGARGPFFQYVNKTMASLARLLLGDEDRALAELTEVVAGQPVEHFLLGMAEGNAFFAAALTRRDTDARTRADPGTAAPEA